MYYIFLISINGSVDLVMQVCTNLQISANLRARDKKLGMKVHLYHTQIMFTSNPRKSIIYVFNLICTRQMKDKIF